MESKPTDDQRSQALSEMAGIRRKLGAVLEAVEAGGNVNDICHDIESLLAEAYTLGAMRGVYMQGQVMNAVCNTTMECDVEGTFDNTKVCISEAAFAIVTRQTQLSDWLYRNGISEIEPVAMRLFEQEFIHGR